jgi:hypothetical protein
MAGFKFEGMRSPLGALEDDSGSTVSFGTKTHHIHFPEDLQQIDHWITFRAYETTQLNRNTKAAKNPLAFIALPCPSNLGVEYKINYTDPDLGATGSNMIEALRDGNGAGVAAGIAGLGGMLAGAAAGGTSTKSIGAGVIGKLALAGGMAAASVLDPSAALSDAAGAAGPMGAAAGAQFGVARNPHKVVMFEGIGFRNHTFKYNFVPQSRAEAEKIRTVISLFKLFGSPSYGGQGAKDIYHTSKAAIESGKMQDLVLNSGKHFFKYPEYFEMDFHYPRFLYQIGPSFLEDVSVSYGGGDQIYWARPDNREDPNPTQISLSLTFKETELVTKENILSENR